jgi:cytochrome c2
VAAKKDSDLHYHTPTLTRWFAITSLVLAVLTVWIILDDHRRPWKKYQQGFLEYDLNRTEELRAVAEAEIPADRLQQIQAQLQQAEESFAQQRAEYKKAQAELSRAEDRLFRVDQQWRNAKAYQDTMRYEYDTALTEKAHNLDEVRVEFEHWNDEVEVQVNELKTATEERDAAQNAVDAFTAGIDAAEDEIETLRQQVARLETKLENLRPTFASKYLLNEPVLDIMAPTLKIRQVVVEGIDQDLHYTEVPRVDRCMTCHMAIDRAEYDAPQPWASHPALDLYLGSTSPHPMEKFGCTTCHFGRDRSVDFTRAVHWPDTHEQEEDWREEYGWKEPTHWDFPMLPSSYVESTCFKCHMDQDRVPGSERASQAEDFFQVFGCFGCHKAQGYEDLRKVGPSLRRFASKVPDREWTHRWLEAPRAFRPKTRMPHFWKQSNNSSAADVPYSDAEIRGITEYVYTRSESMPLPSLPGRGDAARGEDLVKSVGCLGCHVVGDDPAEEALSRLDPRRFGPSLEGIASKATPEWIFQWVKNPRAYWPATRMPDLRLSDREAVDITAYLVTLRKDDFLDTPFPSPEAGPRDEMLSEFFRNTMTDAAARAKLDSMTDHEKWMLMGERSIAKYGCFGCHEMPGFEDANPIGTELSEEGSKSVHLFDFGHVHVPHTRQDWVFQKLKEPRIWDRGKVKSRSEYLKMPNFGFTDEEAQIGTTAVLSFTKDRISDEMRRTLGARDVALEEGRRLVRESNCRGCHELEGEGRAIEHALVNVFQAQGMAEQEAATQADAFAPPLITIEGAKVQPDWLFRFFQEPSTIRTWLQIRMPSFHFTDEEINALITYFNALSEEVYPFKSDPDLRMTRAERDAGVRLASREYFDCFKCHAKGDSPAIAGGNAAEWAPNLSLANGRLKPDWIESWIREPNAIQPGTRMPTYFDPRFFDQTGPPDILGGDEDAQIRALVKYVLSLGEGSSSRSSGATGRQ